MFWQSSVAGMGLALLLSGCSSAPLNSYDLTALGPQTSAHAPRGLLVIAEPLAEQTLDSERILVRSDGNSLAYLAGAQWAERLPKLVQARLVQSFENSHMLRSVSSSGMKITSDAHLETEIRSFEYNASLSEVEVSLSVKLINDRNGKIVKAQLFRAKLPQGTSEGKAVTQGLDQALATVMHQIVVWAGAGM